MRNIVCLQIAWCFTDSSYWWHKVDAPFLRKLNFPSSVNVGKFVHVCPCLSMCVHVCCWLNVTYLYCLMLVLFASNQYFIFAGKMLVLQISCPLASFKSHHASSMFNPNGLLCNQMTFSSSWTWRNLEVSSWLLVRSIQLLLLNLTHFFACKIPW